MADTEVLDFLRVRFDRIEGQLVDLKADMLDLKGRMTSLELAVAQLHGDFARQSLRIDRIEVTRRSPD